MAKEKSFGVSKQTWFNIMELKLKGGFKSVEDVFKYLIGKKEEKKNGKNKV